MFFARTPTQTRLFPFPRRKGLGVRLPARLATIFYCCPRLSSPLLVRGEVGAIPIAPGEVQRQHTRDSRSYTKAAVVRSFFCVIPTGVRGVEGPRIFAS